MTRVPRFSLWACVLASTGFALSGCSALDSAIDGRAHSVNRSSGDYSSVAILTNIVRASRYEPLNFVNLTAFTGHDTFSSAMPSFVLPPANPVAVGFGSSTASTVFSNDFNVSVLDDPGSYAALLEPVNPALMGLFIKAGYPRELVYLLFFDILKIKDVKTGGVDDYRNLPEKIESDMRRQDLAYHCGDNEKHTDRFQFYKTVCKIEGLVKDGLTIDIDSDFQPSSDAIPSYRLCFDTALTVPEYADGERGGFYATFKPMGNAQPKCEPPDKVHMVHAWTYAESTNPSTTYKYTRNPGEPERKVEDAPHQFRPNYTVLDTDGDIVEIHTRSVLGAYQYLGQLLHNDGQFQSLNLRFADTLDNRLLQLTSADNGECFVSTSYDGKNYCVPNKAANTKRIFSLLRQLVGLLTKPNNQPATQTTRTTPN